jgi:hypothetical protein
VAKKKNVSLKGSMRFNRLVTGFNTGWVMQVDQAAHQWLWSFPSKIASIWGYTPFWGTPHEKYAKCEDIP